jgi:hypothetical protein
MMVRHRGAVVCGLLLLGAAVLTPAAAQLSAGAIVSHEYVWRGLLVGDRAIVAPWLAGEWEAGPAAISLGVSVAVEPFAYGAALAGGLSGRRAPGVVDAELWLDAGRAFGRLEATVGAQVFVPSDADGLQTDELTTELYLAVVHGGRIEPAVRIYADVQRTPGFYTEVGVRHEAVQAGVPTVEFVLGVASYAAGEDGYYAGCGITHAEMSAGWAWTMRGIVIEPSLHAQYGVDEETRSGRWPAGRGRYWLGMAFSRASGVP